MNTFSEQFHLKECAFCGSTKLQRVILRSELKPNPMKIKCNTCGFEPVDFKFNMSAAAMEWNEISNFVSP